MTIRNNINIVLKSMESGIPLTLKSGHTLVMARGDRPYDEPGFAATRTNADGTTDEVVFQIGSDEAWGCVIAYAGRMTDEDVVGLVASAVLTENNRKKR